MTIINLYSSFYGGWSFATSERYQYHHVGIPGSETPHRVVEASFESAAASLDPGRRLASVDRPKRLDAGS